MDRAFYMRRETLVFVVNKALNFANRIFFEFYRKRRDSKIAILNDFPRLRKI